MTTPKADPVPDAGLMAVDSSHSTVKEKTGDSHEWSDNSKQDSKQDSKDLPWGRSQIETVKKRPQSLEGSREAAPQRLVARGAMALFAGHLLDQVQEGEELDQSLVELGDDDLRQLDNGVDFSDLEEDRLSGRESGDEDFDFDEPMLSLPTRGRVDRGPENGREEEQGKSLQAELAEAENRLAEGQESEEPDSGRQQTVAPGFGELLSGSSLLLCLSCNKGEVCSAKKWHESEKISSQFFTWMPQNQIMGGFVLSM